MLELIIIFAVALLVLPLVDLLADPQRPTLTRRLKVAIIVITLAWIVYMLFWPPVVSFPAWNVNRR